MKRVYGGRVCIQTGFAKNKVVTLFDGKRNALGQINEQVYTRAVKVMQRGLYSDLNVLRGYSSAKGLRELPWELENGRT